MSTPSRPPKSDIREAVERELAGWTIEWTWSRRARHWAIVVIPTNALHYGGPNPNKRTWVVPHAVTGLRCVHNYLTGLRRNLRAIGARTKEQAHG